MSLRGTLALMLLPVFLLAACDGTKPLIKREPKEPVFPAADRPVASIVSTRWSNTRKRAIGSTRPARS